MSKRNIKLHLCFDGKNYCGWQKQPNHANVQGVLEAKLSRILKDRIKMTGIGRTDAGAHAIFFTANFFTTNFTLPVEKMAFVFNNSLPEDIRIISANEVDLSFHSRFDAGAREYIYTIINTKIPLPFFHDYAHIETRPLNINKIGEACRLFKGVNNFNNYCHGYNIDINYQREIFYFRVRKINFQNFPVIIFFIKGNGFLWGMIRTMVSVCLNYALGNITQDDIEKSLRSNEKIDSRYRSPVSSSGLYFKRGFYS